MKNKELLNINDLTKKYGDFYAVKNISFSFNKGEIFGILGPNGAGKTTTIKMLMGILCPSSGNASIGGFDCFSQRESVMSIIGYVPDDPVFYDYLKGIELIFFAGEMHGLSNKDIINKCDPLIKKLKMEDSLEEFATNYSKGMKKKLSIILALLHEPDLIILDEPTNGLDPYATREVHELILEQKNKGKSILFSTHLLNQAEKLCTDILILSNGEIKARGTLEQLKFLTKQDDSLEELFFSLTTDSRDLNEKQ